MCTVTVCRSERRIIVTMNRDERYERHEGGLFERHAGELAWCFPRDGESEGSWIATSNRGEFACLLNRYDTVTESQRPSRGGLVCEALRRSRQQSGSAWLAHSLQPQRYAPFTLLLYTVDEGLLRTDWNGRAATTALIELDQDYMASSSSESAAEVLLYRQQCFARWQERGRPCVSEVPRFHLEQCDRDPGRSVLMQRTATHSKSLTQLVLEEGGVELRYWDENAMNGWRQHAHLSTPASTYFELTREEGVCHV